MHQRLKEGMLGILQSHIDPAPFASLFDQVGGFHQLQVATDVGLRNLERVYQGLRNLERVYQLADAQPPFYRGQATGQAQAERIAEGREELLRMGQIAHSYIHIFEYVAPLCQAFSATPQQPTGS